MGESCSSDDIDVEALLEDTYEKKTKPSSRRRSRDRAKSPIRSHGSRRRRSSSSDRKKSKERSNREYSPKRRDRANGKEDSSYSSKYYRSYRRDREEKKWSNMVEPKDMVPLTEVEKDARTVLMRQLPRNVSNYDIERFYEDVGKIREIRMISDRNSRRTKGIAYIEFQHVESVTLAIKLNGGKLLGVPVFIQNTMSEKNKAALELAAQAKSMGPTKLYVGSLHPNITEKMLRAIFEPFGAIDNVAIQYDGHGRSKGYGSITFQQAECARQAIEKMDGFELVGNRIKVGQVTEYNEDAYVPAFNTAILDDEEIDKGGVELNATSRTLLMKKLAASRGMADMIAPIGKARVIELPPPCESPTACVVLSNMFDPQKEGSNSELMKEIENDVYKVVSNYATITHCHVDPKGKGGNVYIKLRSTKEAVDVVNDLTGRKYANNTIKAFHISSNSYNSLFPEVLN